MSKRSFDLIIIGGGRASNLALKVAAAGQRVALVERAELGGTCPNRGCVPSKLLIGFADAVRSVKSSKNHFIDSSIQSIDRDAMFKSTRDWSKSVDPRYAGRMKDAGVTMFRGSASFVSNNVIRVATRDGSVNEDITAARIVIASGSRPRPVPDQYIHLPVWTSDDVFQCESPPKSIIIVGGGFIGSELGGFFSGVGIPTTLLVRDQQLLAIEDRDIGEIVKAEFTKHTDTKFGVSVANIEYCAQSDEFTVLLEDGATHKAHKVMFATGRIPNTDSLNLQNTSVKTNTRGFISVNDSLESSVPGVYAAGDVAGRYILQHTASFEVNYLKELFLDGRTTPIDYGLVPHAVFCHPEVASLGKTEQQLEKEGAPYVASLTPWGASAKIMGMRVSYPRTKMLVCPTTYRILGCHLVGPQASTAIHQVSMLVHLKNDVRELLNMIHIHPAVNEIFMVAAADVLGKIKALQKTTVPSKL